MLWYRGGDAAAVERYTSTVLAEEGQLVRLEDYPGPGLACLERLARVRSARPGGLHLGVGQSRAGLRWKWPAGQAVPAACCPTCASPTYAAGSALERHRGRLSCLRPRQGVAEDGPWLGGAGPRLTIADLCVFDLVDMHLAAPGVVGAVKQRFPALMAHHRRVAAQPGAHVCVGGRGGGGSGEVRPT